MQRVLEVLEAAGLVQTALASLPLAQETLRLPFLSRVLTEGQVPLVPLTKLVQAEGALAQLAAILALVLLGLAALA
jgi:hypothetical protein